MEQHLPTEAWRDEPDRVEFRHCGLACLMVRHPEMGHWCGYVAVPPGHPYYGKLYDHVDVDVHGGLTYSAKCDGNICHKPAPGEPDDVWWFGFDCAHLWDLVPRMLHLAKSIPGMPVLPTREVYRDAAYVRAQIESLAGQLHRIQTASDQG